MGADVTRFEMAAPDDAEQIGALLGPDVSDILRLAVVAKIEGSATINDFSRALAHRAIEDQLAQANLRPDVKIQIILSTGCEGVATPGGWLFIERSGKAGLAGLCFGSAFSDALSPGEMISLDHVRIASETTAKAMAEAGLEPEEVALVLIKSPVLTHQLAVGLAPKRRNRANSTSLSRAVAALGAGAALGEIALDEIDDENLRDPRFFSRRTMAFSGTETRRCEAIVLGNRVGSPRSVRSCVTDDLIDIDSMARAIAPQAADPYAETRRMAGGGRLKAAFLKVGLSGDGLLRGRRTTVFSSELTPDKQMRAAASGALAALIGDTRFFVSGGAENQAPPGGGVFAAIIAE